MKVRQGVDLRSTTFAKGKRSNGIPYIMIQPKDLGPSNVINLSFKTTNDFSKWITVMLECHKTDD